MNVKEFEGTELIKAIAEELKNAEIESIFKYGEEEKISNKKLNLERYPDGKSDILRKEISKKYKCNSWSCNSYSVNASSVYSRLWFGKC